MCSSHPHSTPNLITTEEAQDGFRPCIFHPDVRATAHPSLIPLTTSTEPARVLDSESPYCLGLRGPLGGLCSSPARGTEAISVPGTGEVSEVEEEGRPA